MVEGQHVHMILNLEVEVTDNSIRVARFAEDGDLLSQISTHGVRDDARHTSIYLSGRRVLAHRREEISLIKSKLQKLISIK